MSTLFSKITSIENIEKAYKQSQKGSGKYKRSSLLLEKNKTYFLKKIREELIDGTYTFGDYNRFTVYEPKERIIDAPRLKDKIVQLAINNVIKEEINNKFIHDTYACIDNKGTHKAVYRISHFMRKAKWMWGDDARIIKIDIKKFFYTIDREVTKKEFSRHIKCKDTLDLINKVIDSADQISPKGLPLGNTLSQIGANITMNPLDQYAKRKLRLKFYVRYADDIVIIVKNKKGADYILDKLITFIEDRLNLNVNLNKTKIFPIRQGVNVLGYKIHATHKLLRNESKKKVKRKLKKMKYLIRDGRLTVDKAELMLNSWKGHADHANSNNFIKSLTTKYDFLKLKDNKLKIKEDEIFADIQKQRMDIC